jgi:hypothetical protein
MGFWDKSLRIFKCLRDNGKQSIRQLAQQTGFAKSSVHRLQQAMEHRTGLASRWRGACGLTPCWGRWKRPFDFPILCRPRISRSSSYGLLTRPSGAMK